MDPLTSTVVALIGKYAVDKGATLLKEAGQAAVDVAARLFEKIIGKLKADPAEAKNAERFEKNPEEFKAPVAAAVEEKMQAEPDFAAELKKLVEEFETAKSAAGITVAVSGSGAAAAQGSVAASTGATVFQVGGNAGDISIGKNVKFDDNKGEVNITFDS